MGKVTKLIQQELDLIQNLKNRKKALKEELGAIGITELNLKIRREQTEKFYLENIELEKKVAKDLQVKYGQGNINLETGEFTAS